MTNYYLLNNTQLSTANTALATEVPSNFYTIQPAKVMAGINFIRKSSLDIALTHAPNAATTINPLLTTVVNDVDEKSFMCAYYFKHDNPIAVNTTAWLDSSDNVPIPLIGRGLVWMVSFMSFVPGPITALLIVHKIPQTGSRTHLFRWENMTVPAAIPGISIRIPHLGHYLDPTDTMAVSLSTINTSVTNPRVVVHVLYDQLDTLTAIEENRISPV